jgi:hypothetical protein
VVVRVYLAVGDSCSGVSFLITFNALRGVRKVVPVAVFFLPKHCTLWEAMLGNCDVGVR